MKIIRATVDRAENVGFVHAMSWQRAYQGIVPQEYLAKITPERRADMYRKTLASSQDEYYLAFLDEQPMGMLVLGISRDADASESVGEIYAIYLLADYWDQGYGKQLMNFALSRLKELSYRTVTLWVMEKNNRARRFYERYGFVLDGSEKELVLGKPFVIVRYAYAIL